MEEKRVSVVVPVYNVRDYLEECLESVLGQTYKNLEILLVDDGSTDGSSEICDAFSRKDSRVKVIHQGNAGAAAARIAGILASTGEFLCFADGDDSMDLGMIRYLMENCDEADLVTSGCWREESDGSITKREDAFEEGIYQTEEEIAYIICNVMAFQGRLEDGILPYLWNKLYRTELLKKIIKKNDERVNYAEDRELVLRYLLRCRRIVITRKCLYHYRYRASSAVHAPNPFFLQDLHGFYNHLRPEFEQHIQRDSLLWQLQRFVMSRTLLAARMMGFCANAQCIRYIFPFYNLLNDKKVILYGAGLVGKDYYRQMKTEKDDPIVLWADKNWQKYQDMREKIAPIEQICKVAFDVVIIAVKKRELAESIMADLNRMGISQRKMLWKAPVDLLAV